MPEICDKIPTSKKAWDTIPQLLSYPIFAKVIELKEQKKCCDAHA
jgi:hypothetical protein